MSEDTLPKPAGSSEAPSPSKGPALDDLSGIAVALDGKDRRRQCDAARTLRPDGGSLPPLHVSDTGSGPGTGPPRHHAHHHDHLSHHAGHRRQPHGGERDRRWPAAGAGRRDASRKPGQLRWQCRRRGAGPGRVHGARSVDPGRGESPAFASVRPTHPSTDDGARRSAHGGQRFSRALRRTGGAGPGASGDVATVLSAPRWGDQSLHPAILLWPRVAATGRRSLAGRPGGLCHHLSVFWRPASNQPEQARGGRGHDQCHGGIHEQHRRCAASAPGRRKTDGSRNEAARPSCGNATPSS